MHRVVVLVGAERASDAAAIDAIDPCIRAALAGRVELVELATAEAEAAHSPVRGVLTLAHAPIDGALLDRLSPGRTLRVVANYGVGLDHFNLDDLRQREIPAANTPDVLSGATADLGFALLVACARRIPEGDRYCRGGQYTAYKNMLLLGTDIHHKTIGIVGMGRIGSEVAHRAQGFHMRLLYHNRTARPEVEAALGAQLVDLDTLLAQADFVMLTCPYTKDTHHMLTMREFEKMKPTAILVNIARGGVVKTEDLVEALRRGKIAMAGLDVTDPEPLPLEHPLTTMDNVVLVPHRGSATRETRRLMAELMLENLFLGLEGKPLRTPCV